MRKGTGQLGAGGQGECVCLITSLPTYCYECGVSYTSSILPRAAGSVAAAASSVSLMTAELSGVASME